MSRREKGDLPMLNMTYLRHVLVFWALCFLSTFLLHAAEPAQIAPAPASQSMVLWYRQPAATWLQAMPLGNGLIGAMAFGGVPQERIALNESSFWSGRPHNYDSPEAFQDFSQIRDLVFADKFQEAEKILKTDEDFGAKLAAALKRLPPYRITSRGTLQEWIEDWTPGTEGHNVSPNFPFFPGSTITLRGTSELAAAVNKWMETRQGRGGWISAWDTSVWARLERGEKVELWMRALVRNSLADNLHNRGSNQSDANFGLTAAVAEALLQSHAGEISLLPALPPSWSAGSVSGLRARGGFEVAMQWKDGRLQSATIRTTRNAAPATFKVRSGAKTEEVSIKAGQTVRLNADLVAAK